MEGKQSALNILTFVTTLKGQKILGALEPDTGFQVGKALCIAALIWQAFFAYFFGRLQKSRGPYGP